MLNKEKDGIDDVERSFFRHGRSSPEIYAVARYGLTGAGT